MPLLIFNVLSEAEITNVEISFLIENCIGRLQIFVHNAVCVHLFESEDNACDKELDLLFSEGLFLLLLLIVL